VIAVTAACARLLGLTVEQTETALALSTSLAAGTKANFGTMTKPLHAGQCARGGLMAALLARKGFTANPDAFEHKQGFLKLFSDSGEYDSAAVLQGWGEPLAILKPGAGYKLYPCCYSTHSATQGALSLVREHGVFDPEAIERVETRTSERGLAHTDRPRPRSALEAKFSVQYCVARALADGKVALEHFDENAYAEPRMQALLAKVHAVRFEGPFSSKDRFDARIKVSLTDGRALEAKVDAPLGRGTADPVSRDALDAKFRDCATRVLGAAAADAASSAIWAVGTLGSVRELTELLESADIKTGERRLEAAA
jgi:2-methylcitrate dehydratase PrpD